jgi:hypothetical protein
MRCPVCFGREIDVLLLYDGEEHYCVKCSFRGTTTEVRRAYQDHQKKFRNISTRLEMDDIEKL